MKPVKISQSTPVGGVHDLYKTGEITVDGAVEALVGMGYKRSEARNLISKWGDPVVSSKDRTEGSFDRTLLRELEAWLSTDKKNEYLDFIKKSYDLPEDFNWNEVVISLGDEKFYEELTKAMPSDDVQAFNADYDALFSARKKWKHPDEVAKDNGADITCSKQISSARMKEHLIELADSVMNDEEFDLEQFKAMGGDNNQEGILVRAALANMGQIHDPDFDGEDATEEDDQLVDQVTALAHSLVWGDSKSYTPVFKSVPKSTWKSNLKGLDKLERRSALKEMYDMCHWEFLNLELQGTNLNDPENPMMQVAPDLCSDANDLHQFLLECAKENLPGARENLRKVNSLLGIQSSKVASAKNLNHPEFGGIPAWYDQVGDMGLYYVGPFSTQQEADSFYNKNVFPNLSKTGNIPAKNPIAFWEPTENDRVFTPDEFLNEYLPAYTNTSGSSSSEWSSEDKETFNKEVWRLLKAKHPEFVDENYEEIKDHLSGWDSGSSDPKKSASDFVEEVVGLYSSRTIKSSQGESIHYFGDNFNAAVDKFGEQNEVLDYFNNWNSSGIRSIDVKDTLEFDEDGVSEGSVDFLVSYNDGTKLRFAAWDGSGDGDVELNINSSKTHIQSDLKRDIQKMIEYRQKGSNPEALARSVKDMDKAKNRLAIAKAMGWSEAEDAFFERLMELGASNDDIMTIPEVDLSEVSDSVNKASSVGATGKRSLPAPLDRYLRSLGLSYEMESMNPTKQAYYKDLGNGRRYTLMYKITVSNGAVFYFVNHSNEGGGTYGYSLADDPNNSWLGEDLSVAKCLERLKRILPENQAVASSRISSATRNGGSMRRFAISSSVSFTEESSVESASGTYSGGTWSVISVNSEGDRWESYDGLMDDELDAKLEAAGIDPSDDWISDLGDEGPWFGFAFVPLPSSLGDALIQFSGEEPDADEAGVISQKLVELDDSGALYSSKGKVNSSLMQEAFELGIITQAELKSRQISSMKQSFAESLSEQLLDLAALERGEETVAYAQDALGSFNIHLFKDDNGYVMTINRGTPELNEIQVQPDVESLSAAISVWEKNKLIQNNTKWSGWAEK